MLIITSISTNISLWILQVKHTQLEDGYYKAALGVLHIQSTEQIGDDELLQYLRSEAEVHFMFFNGLSAKLSINVVR